MFITSEEKESDSPLQSLLEGASIMLKFNKILKDLEPKLTTHNEVQEAVNDDN